MVLNQVLIVASLMAVALAGFAAAEYNQKPEYYKPPAYVAKNQKPEYYKPPAYVAKNPKPEYYKPPAYMAKPKDYNVAIQVQGGVYCRNYGKLSPLPGAMVRLTCISVSGKGRYESAPFSVVSKATDDKGYFKINLSKYDVGPYKLSGCKVFLETPPPGECSVPTDVNYGVSGAPLSPNYRVLSDHTRLYSVLPFVYTTPSY